VNRDLFISLMLEALKAIRDPRFFQTERGYQGELLAMLRARLPEAGFPGDPIIEQEYQKRVPDHGIKLRPDLIIHIPFDRGTSENRKAGNFVAIEIKRRSADVQQAFESLRMIHEALNYQLTVLVNIDSQQTHAEECPASIAQQTVCFAVMEEAGAPVVRVQACGTATTQ
jgi:hypothetical protein